MKLTITIIALTSCLAFSNCTTNGNGTSGSNSQTDTIVNILAIANKPIEGATNQLGKPDSVINTNTIVKINPAGTPNETVPSEVAYYKNKKFIITYINKLAWHININNPKNLLMSEYMITSLGLPHTNPTILGTSYISWQELDGFEEITFSSSDSSSVDNIYIRVNQKR